MVGSIYGRSSLKFAYFVLIHLQTWPQQAIIVSDWLISKKYSPLKLLSQINSNFCRKHLWKGHSKFGWCCPYPLTNMAAAGTSCFCATGRYQCWQRTSTTYCSIAVKVAYIVMNIWQWCRWELILLIKLRFSSPGKGNLSRLSLSCLDPFVLLLPKLWKLFGFAIFQFLCVPDEVYSRNTPCALNLI